MVNGSKKERKGFTGKEVIIITDKGQIDSASLPSEFRFLHLNRIGQAEYDDDVEINSNARARQGGGGHAR